MPKSNWLVAGQALMGGVSVLGKFASAKLKTGKTKSVLKELGYTTELYKLFETQQEATSGANLGKAIQITEEIIQYLNDRPETSLTNREAHQIILAGQILSLGGYFLELGDLERAEPKFIEALAIFIGLGQKPKGYALTIYNLGYLSFRKALSDRDNTSRQLHLNRAVEKLSEAFQELKIIYAEEPTVKNDTYISRSLQLLAITYQQLGEYRKAKEICWEAINWKLMRSREKLGDSYTPKFNSLLKLLEVNLEDGAFLIPWFAFMKDWVDILTLLGEIHFDEGDYRSTERLYLKSLNTLKVLYEGERERLFDVVNSEHPDLNDLFIGIGQLMAAKNKDYYSALEYLKKSLQISAYEIRIRFAISSEKDRLAIVQTQRKVLDILLSMVWKYLREDPSAIKFAFDTVLKRKSLTATALAVQNGAVLSDRYPELRDKFEKLKSLNEQIINLIYSLPSPNKNTELKKQQEDFDALQRELGEKIPELKLETNLQNTCGETVEKSLPANSLLVEIIRFDVYNFQAIPACGDSRLEPARYLAFILPQGRSQEIKMIDLGVAEEIDKMGEDFLLSVAAGYGNQLDMFDDGETEEETATFSGPEYDFQLALNLSQALLAPLLPNLGEAQHLIIAPDSNLNLIPFNILPVDEDGTFLSDSYTVSYLSVGRDILSLASPPPEPLSPPLIIADPDFDLQYTRVEDGASVTLTGQSPDLTRDIAHRAFRRAPGTRILGEMVAENLGVRAYTGQEALESLIYRYPSPKIFFIATHGVYLPPSSPLPTSPAVGNLLLQVSPENPMLRSGLALAGANTFLSRGKLGKSQGKGFLLAQDILLQNFSGTEIVFLIACQTGKGDTSAGEGVFGMRRAFAVAGARTLIMSLWKVPDLESSLLIGKFFEYLRADGSNKAAALARAQDYIRGVTVAELKQTPLGVEILKKLCDSEDWEIIVSGRLDECPLQHPYYWGAWICQGAA